jgi:hypothetical protein
MTAASADKVYDIAAILSNTFQGSTRAITSRSI